MLNNNLSNIIRAANSSQRLELWSADYLDNGAYFALYSKDFSAGYPDDSSAGTFRLSAYQNKILTGTPNGELIWDNTNLGGAAIVAQSFGLNGYIKYASGLILQWGSYATPSGTYVTEYTLPVPFNISFANYCRVVCSCSSDSINNQTAVTVLDGGQYIRFDNFTVRLKLLSEASDPVLYTGIHWFAIGY